MVLSHHIFLLPQVTSVSFSEEGNSFVTVGTRHVKFWDLEASCKSRVSKMQSTSRMPVHLGIIIIYA